MKLLFNKSDNGAAELRELTGSYYANNDFSKIRIEVTLETEKLVDLIGEAVYNRAAQHYHGDRYQATEPTETEQLNDDLVQHLQLPIAMMAAFRFYQTNLVSHEDTGRKIKLDEGKEKMAWEWMLDRDDDAHIRKAYNTIDRLIRFLDKHDPDEWKSSDQKKATKQLFIGNTEEFNDIYPIDNSPRFFYSTLPFNREVQREIIRKALGDRYDSLLQYFQAPPAQPEPDKEELLDLVKLAIPINVMVIALKRFPVQVLPEGVVQQFKTGNQFARTASQPAPQEALRLFALALEQDAAEAINNLKKYLNRQDPDALKYQYLPKNDPCNKYFRT